ncbi:MAG: hypothetical protein WCE51_04130 [Chthoniobacterales bacterium]
MKTNLVFVAILICSCLSSFADGPKPITQQNVDQIRIGQTTEAELVRLFGTPSDKTTQVDHAADLIWFRVAPLPLPAYAPIIGLFVENTDVAQMLTVHLDPAGRVARYDVSSIKDKPAPASNPQSKTPREYKLTNQGAAR